MFAVRRSPTNADDDTSLRPDDAPGRAGRSRSIHIAGLAASVAAIAVRALRFWPVSLDGLDAPQLAEYAGRAADVTVGLGNEVRVAGLSRGGVVALGVAQHRAGVDEVVAITPAMELPAVPNVVSTFVTNLFLRVPTITRSHERHIDQEYAALSTRGLDFAGSWSDGSTDPALDRRPATRLDSRQHITNRKDPVMNSQTPPDLQVHPPASLPIGLGFLAMLGGFQGLVTIALGLFLVLDRNDAELIDHTQLSSAQLAAVGVGALIGGSIHFLLALALSRGSNIVRFLLGVVTLINVAAAFWGVVATHGEQRLTASIALVIGLAILWILFGSARSQQYFAEH